MKQSSIMSTPTNYQDLFTRFEVSQILQNMLGPQQIGKLLNYTVQPELSSIGYLGEYYHLHLQYQLEKVTDTEQHKRLFVKTMPYQNAAMCLFFEKSGILRKEIAVYERLLSKICKFTETIWCPQMYYSRKDLFVLQNISDLGYDTVRNMNSFLNTAQMNMLLKSLATMHACSIAYEIKNETNIGKELEDVLYEVGVLPTVRWYTAGIRAVLAVALEHPSYQSNAARNFIKEKLPQLLNTVYDMVNPSTKYRNVFCHRDPWGGNIFYSTTKPHTTPAVFVDFQLCRYCPAAIDVLMAVYLNITPHDRTVLASKFYHNYYMDFVQIMASMGLKADAHMTQVEFEQSIEELKLFGALYNCMSATMLRVPGDYLHDMKLNRPKDFHHYANVDRTNEVLKLLHTETDFRNYMFDCVAEMLSMVYT